MMQPTPNETQIHTDELVDIREVSVDKNLPKEERIAAFIRQIKNPYRFRCGDFVVNACFAGNGVTLTTARPGQTSTVRAFSRCSQILRLVTSTASL